MAGTDDLDSSDGGDIRLRKELANPILEDDLSAREIEELVGLTADHYLYLSGTPFRALANGDFLEDQIYNWTYTDEQREKRSFAASSNNPYASLPRMTMLVYEMPDELKEDALNNFAEISLTEFFRTEPDPSGAPKFKHENSVQRFIDLLQGQNLKQLWTEMGEPPPLPFDDANLLQALQHTIWYMPGIDSCVAMGDLLRRPHNFRFSEYEIVVAAGDHVGGGADALEPVLRAIGEVPQESKSITLSCGKLLTGVTVPPWGGILMLRELQSPESYFQAAFRTQSTWTSKVVDTDRGGKQIVVHKHECFVIDFSPNRALSLIADYATNTLGSQETGERDVQKSIDDFLDFFPVLSFQGDYLEPLDASDVLGLLSSGTTTSMLARRWNSTELLTLDLVAMQNILADADLLQALESIDRFSGDHGTIDCDHHFDKRTWKKATYWFNVKKGQEAETEADRKRKALRQNLRHLITRLPVFMYLTDDRERALKDVLAQTEDELFQQVTDLTLATFFKLVAAGVFDEEKMDDAVWKFRRFESRASRTILLRTLKMVLDRGGRGPRTVNWTSSSPVS